MNEELNQQSFRIAQKSNYINHDTITPKTATLAFPWGQVDIHFDDKNKDAHAKHTVYEDGEFQFNTVIGKHFTRQFTSKIPYDIHINIMPNISEDKTSIIDKNMETWNFDYKKDIQIIENFLKALNYQADIEIIHHRFSEFQQIPLPFETDEENSFRDLNEMQKIGFVHLDPNSPIIVEDNMLLQDGIILLQGELTYEKNTLNGPILTPARINKDQIDENRAIFHNNLNIDIIKETALKSNSSEKDVRKFFTEISDVIRDFKEKLIELPNYERLKTDKLAYGISIDATYHGVYIKTPFETLYLNPSNSKAKSPAGMAADWTHTLMHEASHAQTMNHDESFTNTMADLYRDINDEHPAYIRKMEEKLEKIATENWHIVEKMKEIFYDPSTKNVSRSLEGARDQYTRESRSNSQEPSQRPSQNGIRKNNPTRNYHNVMEFTQGNSNRGTRTNQTDGWER